MKATTDVHLIRETPSDKDGLVGRGHSRSAEELTRVVRQMLRTGGSIGLEGQWGSGKSTVIKLSQEIFSSKERSLRSVVFLTLDLWSYQSADFRAALLRKMLGYTRATFPHLSKYCDQKEREIATKRSDTERLAEKSYSLAAIYAILLTPLLPVAFAWIAPSYIQSTSEPLKIFGVLLSEIVIVAIMAGYAIVALSLLARLFSTRDQIRNTGLIKWLSRGVSNSISLFARESDGEFSRTTTTEQDPLRNKFHDTFANVLATIKENCVDVVFVFDNIDRLPPENVPSIFADIRLLFDSDSFTAATAAPVIVVPFDRKHLVNVLQQSMSMEIDDFINKTFDRVIRVSPPVLSDWRGYLEQCLDKVFRSTISKEDRYKLYQALEYQQPISLPPTPRKLVAFANEVGGLWAQWSGEIPLLSIAMYIVAKGKLGAEQSIVDRLKELSFPATKLGAHEDWYKHLAALEFNVHPDHAYQVLLQPQLRSAIVAETEAGLAAIQPLPGFSEVLTQTVVSDADDWARDSDGALYKAARNLSAIGVDGAYGETVWRALREALPELPLRRLNELETTALANIVLQQTTSAAVSDAAIKLLSWASRCVNAPKGSDQEHGRIWLINLLRLIEIVDDRGGSGRDLLQYASVPHASAPAIGVAIACLGTKLRFRDIPRKVPSENLIDALLAYSGQEDARSDEVFVELALDVGEDSITRIVSDLSEALLASSGSRASFSGSNIALLARAISYLPDAMAPNSAQIKLIIDDGTLLFHSHSAYLKGYVRSFAAAAWLNVAITGQIEPSHPAEHKSYGDLSQAQESYSSSLSVVPPDEALTFLVELIEREDKISNWLRLVSIKTQIAPVTAVSTVIKRKEYTCINVVRVVIEYASIRTAIGPETASSLLKEFQKWSEHFEDSIGDAEIRAMPAIFVTDAEPYPLLDWFSHRLMRAAQNFDVSEWLECLRGDTQTLHAIIARPSRAKATLPTQPLRDALLQHIHETLINQNVPSANISDWGAVVRLMQPRTRQKFIDELYKTLCRSSPSQAAWDQVYIRFGAYLQHMRLDRNVPKSIDRIIVPLVKSEVEGSAGTLAALTDQIAILVKRASKSATQRLRRSVEIDANSDNSQMKQKVRLLEGVLTRSARRAAKRQT